MTAAMRLLERLLRAIAVVRAAIWAWAETLAAKLRRWLHSQTPQSQSSLDQPSPHHTPERRVMASLFPQPYFKGEPLGVLEFYRSGTLTPEPVFLDVAGNVATTRVVADTVGRFPTFWINDATTYRVIEKTAGGETLTDTDPVSVSGGGGGSLVSGSVASLTELAEIEKASLTTGSCVIVNGFATAGDGGGGTFRWDAASTAAAVAGMVVLPLEGGTGRWSRIDQGPLNALWFGAKGDDATVNTTALQTAVTFMRNSGRALLIPAGTYRTGPLDLGAGDGNDIDIYGESETRLRAISDGQVVVTIGNDAGRDGYKAFRRIKIDGGGKADVTCLKTGDPAFALLNLILEDLLLEDAAIGYEIGNLQECRFYNIVTQNHTVAGTVVQQDATNGGATVLTFQDCRWQNNRTAFFGESNAAPGVVASGWTFINPLFQSNSLAGLAIFGTGTGSGAVVAVTLINPHFENNGFSTTDSDTQSLRGRTIVRAGMQISGDVASTIIEGQLGDGTSIRGYVGRVRSSFTIVGGSLGGGQKLQVDNDATSKVYFAGKVSMTGSMTGVAERSGVWFEGSGTLIGPAPRLPSMRVRNAYAGTGLYPNAPEAENPTAGVTVSKVYDVERGDVQRVAFASGAGSAGSATNNRVTFSTHAGSLTVGDFIAVDVEVRATAATTLGLRLFTNTPETSVVGPANFAITTDWQLITLVAKIDTAAGGGATLYAYPVGTDGPTVEFSNMMTARSVTGSDMAQVADVVRYSLYDDMRQPVYGSAIPTSGTHPRGKRIINRLPTVGQARAWVKVTTGSNNVLGTDWISEGNL